MLNLFPKLSCQNLTYCLWWGFFLLNMAFQVNWVFIVIYPLLFG